MPSNVISIHRARNRIAYARRKERKRCQPHVDRVLGLYRQLANIESLDEFSARRLIESIKTEVSTAPFEYGFEYLWYQAMLYALWKSYCRSNSLHLRRIEIVDCGASYASIHHTITCRGRVARLHQTGRPLRSECSADHAVGVHSRTGGTGVDA